VKTSKRHMKWNGKNEMKWNEMKWNEMECVTIT